MRKAGRRLRAPGPRARLALGYPVTIALGIAYSTVYALTVSPWLGAGALAVALVFAVGQRWGEQTGPTEPESVGLRVALAMLILIAAGTSAAATGEIRTFYLVAFPAIALVPAATAIDRGARVQRRQNVSR